jgi:pimeloyl-ACP methyl ester carboxylesterase
MLEPPRLTGSGGPSRRTARRLAVGAALVLTGAGIAATSAFGTSSGTEIPACAATPPAQVQANSWPRTHRHLAPKGALEINLCQYSGLNAHPASSLVGSDLVKRQRVIRRLVAKFDALRAFPKGVFIGCPADDGSQVVTTLFYSGHQVTISTGLTGCEQVTNGNLRRTAANFANRNPEGPRLVAQLERLSSRHQTAGTAGLSKLHVQWMQGYNAPGTPAKYNKVGVIKVGPAGAKNVLVLEPGTSAAASYFVPLAKWIVSTRKGWQVWAVQRRENLLDDESLLNQAKEGKASTEKVFNYYLGYLDNKSVKHHFQFIPDSTVEYAKRWGMSVAVHDLHTVIQAAHKLGGKVVLGGHSLGGSVVTAYATWNFGGHAGADGLSGLVFIDGGSFPAETAADAQQ